MPQIVGRLCFDIIIWLFATGRISKNGLSSHGGVLGRGLAWSDTQKIYEFLEGGSNECNPCTAFYR